MVHSKLRAPGGLHAFGRGRAKEEHTTPSNARAMPYEVRGDGSGGLVLYIDLVCGRAEHGQCARRAQAGGKMYARAPQPPMGTSDGIKRVG